VYNECFEAVDCEVALATNLTIRGGTAFALSGLDVPQRQLDVVYAACRECGGPADPQAVVLIRALRRLDIADKV